MSVMRIENNIIIGPDDTDLFEAPSFGHLIVDSLTKGGDKILLIDGITGETLSANQILSKSIEYAKSLLAAGIKAGDVVSIVSENRFECPFVLFGTVLLNCTLAPMNHTYSEDELKHALNLSKPKIIFASKATSGRVLRVANLNYVQKVVLLDGGAFNQWSMNLKEFLDPKLTKNIRYEPKAVDKTKAIMLVMCSSGTTGLPKGVQLSQANFLYVVRYTNRDLLAKPNVEGGEHIMLGLLPLFHGFGISILISTIVGCSGQIVLLQKFDEKIYLSSIEKFRITTLFLVPPLMVFLSKHELVDKYDLSSLRFILCGAAPLSKEVEMAVFKRLRNPELVLAQGYGMTELSVFSTSNKALRKPGSVGEVNASVYAKVVDKNNKALGPNQIGELCFAGMSVMVGYIGNKQATREIIDDEGWLHTGDVGYYDEDLQFFIVDRIKELIKWKAFQVPPAEIEALLLTHPKIKDCGVIGKPDDFAGELPLAFVVKGDPNLTEAEVIKFVHGRASPPKRLHGGVIFVDEIPKNPSGKIIRRKLRELLKDELKSKL